MVMKVGMGVEGMVAVKVEVMVAKVEVVMVITLVAVGMGFQVLKTVVWSE